MSLVVAPMIIAKVFQAQFEIAGTVNLQEGERETFSIIKLKSNAAKGKECSNKSFSVVFSRKRAEKEGVKQLEFNVQQAKYQISKREREGERVKERPMQRTKRAYDICYKAAAAVAASGLFLFSFFLFLNRTSSRFICIF